MAFPVVESDSTSQDTAADVTSHTVDMPAGIVAGDLLVAFFACDGNPTITWPSGANDGFTKIGTDIANGSATILSVAYRDANGSEPATIEVTTSDAERSSHVVYRISGHDTAIAPEKSPGATGATTNPDPDSLDPAGAAKDFLWLATGGADRNETWTDAPIDYTNLVTVTPPNNKAATIGSARRNLNADQENPGQFTKSGTRAWVAVTVAVHPSGVTPPVTLIPVPVTMAWIAPAPSVVAGPVTLTPSATVANWIVGLPVLVSQTTLAAAVVAAWVIPVQTLVIQPVILTPSATVSSWVVPVPTVVTGPVTFIPAPAIATWIVPTATIGAPAGEFLTPAPVVASWSAPAATLVIQPFSLTPGAVFASWIIPVQTLVIQPVALSPTPAVANWTSPTPIVTTPPFALTPLGAVASWVVPAATILTPIIPITTGDKTRTLRRGSSGY